MAKAFLRKHGEARFTIYSAVLHLTGIHPLTYQHQAKSVGDFLGKLRVVCERTERECTKIFPGALRRHYWPFPDPVSNEGPAMQLAAFRMVRDAIEQRVLAWLRDPDASEVVIR